MNSEQKINSAVNLTLIILIIIVLSQPVSIGKWLAKIEKGYNEEMKK